MKIKLCKNVLSFGFFLLTSIWWHMDCKQFKGIWWTNNFGKADHWQFANVVEKIPLPKIDYFLVYPVDVSYKCQDSDCNQLELGIIFHINSLIEITFQMVRQNIFHDEDNQSAFSYRCLYQQYNPMFGLKDYLRNGFRFVAKTAALHFCPNDPNPLSSMLLFFTASQPLEEDADAVYEENLYIVKYNSFKRNVFIEMVEGSKIAIPQQNEFNNFFRLDNLDTIPISLYTSIYKNEIVDVLSKAPWVQERPSFWKILNKWKANDLFDQSPMLSQSNEKNEAPYFKIEIVHSGCKKDCQLYNTALFSKIYYADLILRRLGVRLLVVKNTIQPVFPMLNSQTKCETDLINILEQATLERNYDPIKINAVLYIHNVFNNCPPRFHLDVPRRYYSKKIGTRMLWMMAPPPFLEQKENSQLVRLFAFKIFSAVITFMVGQVNNDSGCAYEGCSARSQQNLHMFNFYSMNFHSNTFQKIDFAFMYLRPYLKKPINYEWNENYSVCGDGILSPDEECDCHAIGCIYFDSNSKNLEAGNCCHRHTCKLQKDAFCSLEPCCFQAFCMKTRKPNIHECRPARDQCDSPEYCDGKSLQCPPDLRQPNYQKCNNGYGSNQFCFEGQCVMSVKDKCKYFDPLSNFENEEAMKNTRGTGYYNCGQNEDEYVSCSSEDYVCGSLHCDKSSMGMSYYLNNKSKTKPVALNGSGCSNDKVCINQKCTSVFELEKAKCKYDCRLRGKCMLNNICKCEPNKKYVDKYCSIQSDFEEMTSESPSASTSDFSTNTGTITSKTESSETSSVISESTASNNFKTTTTQASNEPEIMHFEDNEAKMSLILIISFICILVFCFCLFAAFIAIKLKKRSSSTDILYVGSSNSKQGSSRRSSEKKNSNKSPTYSKNPNAWTEETPKESPKETPKTAKSEFSSPASSSLLKNPKALSVASMASTGFNLFSKMQSNVSAVDSMEFESPDAIKQLAKKK